MQVEDGLPGPGADVDDDLVVLQARDARRLGDEVEHRARIFGGEATHVAERVDVLLGDHEQVRVGLRIDVAQSDEAVDLVYVVALAIEPAEETVVRQRGSPPP